jgi:hypothetical protein
VKDSLRTIPCTLQHAGFRNDRGFVIPCTGGTTIGGVCNQEYAWSKDGLTHAPEVPPGEKAEGRVTVRVLSQENGMANVLLPPDNQLLRVPIEILKPLAKEEETDTAASS